MQEIEEKPFFCHPKVSTVRTFCSWKDGNDIWMRQLQSKRLLHQLVDLAFIWVLKTEIGAIIWYFFYTGFGV
jgi:hypothetical protein